MLSLWRFDRVRQCGLEGCKNNEGCQSNDPRGVENLEDWNVQCCGSGNPVVCCAPNSPDSRVPRDDPDGDEWGMTRSTRCMRDVQEVDFGGPLNDRDGDEDEAQTTKSGERAQPTERDIAAFKEAKRREHFEGMVPGSFTPYPWRSMYYGRGRPI